MKCKVFLKYLFSLTRFAILVVDYFFLQEDIMAEIRPFVCVRPAEELASRVAALPYDVYNRQEAKEEVQREPLSFLKIDRAETNFDDNVDTYAPEVYQKAKELLQKDKQEGVYITDEDRSYYIYQLVMDGRPQTGLVACSSVDDYMNHVIKKHENTREDKEIDRITHVDTCSAQTGPIFLAYRSDKGIHDIVASHTAYGKLRKKKMWMRFIRHFRIFSRFISRMAITVRLPQ